MFSGIIEKNLVAVKIEKRKNSMRVYFPIPAKWKIGLGESISIDGVCSTVEKLTKDTFTVYFMPETLSKTTMPLVALKHGFNLERCLTLQTLIGGHLVSGHIDTTAKILSIDTEGESQTLKFKIDKKWVKYIIYKGSITINGVSLTVVEVGPDYFIVSLIPHTLLVTNLGKLQIGDAVNIELDLIAKYLEKLIAC